MAGRDVTETDVTETAFTVFYGTNLWNHYQEAFCREMVGLMGSGRFTLGLFEPVDAERLRLGWQAAPPTEPWIAGPPREESQRQRLLEMALAADVAVLGSCPAEVLDARAASGKLTLFMGERLWKRPLFPVRIASPRTLRAIWRTRRRLNRPNVHCLAIGAYAASDLQLVGACAGRIWKWGYFSDVPQCPPRARTSSRLRVLWAGRMIRWKRVDLLIRAAAAIKNEPGFDALDLVGDGEERRNLMGLAQRLELNDRCRFLGAKAPEEVRRLMGEADVFVLPSDRNEGWGVVANEAMAEGAVLVASRSAGASPVLVEDGRDGFLFEDGDVDGVVQILRRLMRDPDLASAVRQAAWEKLKRLWSPRCGAERLVTLCSGLLGCSQLPRHEEGPGSCA